MKIGKFKKILVAGLVCALSFGLITNTKIVNAAVNSTVKLTWKDRHDRYSKSVTLQYIDENGNAINAPTVKNTSFYYDNEVYIANEEGEYAKVDGYTFKGAYLQNNTNSNKVNRVKGVGQWDYVNWNYDYKLQYHLSGDNDKRWKNFSDQDNAIVYMIFEKVQPLDTVDTVDSSKYVTINMYEYKNRSGEDTEYIGGAYSNGGVTENLLNNKLSDGQPTYGNNSILPYFSKTENRIIDERYTNLNHLFLQDTYDSTGYYEYSSFNNFATLESNGNFKVYDALGTPNNADALYYKRGNFFPLDDIEAGKLSTNKNQYDEYGKSLHYGDENYNKDLYLVNSPTYHFGMDITASFVQLKNGQVANPSSGELEDMIYEFNGDDDLWVYIDNVLVLDIGGIHDACTGQINFATGNVTYTDNKGKHNTTIKRMFEEAGIFPDGTVWNNQKVNQYFKGDTFTDYSGHTMKMFYMERGEGASNLKVRFNLPVVPKGEIQIAKQLSAETDPSINAGDTKFQFQLFLNNDEVPQLVDKEYYENNYNGSEAYIKDGFDGERKEDIEWSEDGQSFWLNPGEVAVFPGFNENDVYFVKELGVKSELYDKVTIEGVEVTTDPNEDGTIDYVSKNLVVGNNAIVTYTNNISVANLKYLKITKHLTSNQNSKDTYDVEVKLDDQKYIGDYWVFENENATSDQQNGKKMTTTDGIIQLKQDQVVYIYNILSGVDFNIVETKLDSLRYENPAYQVQVVTDGDSILNNGSSGKIDFNSKGSSVIITNTLKTGKLQITKVIDNAVYDNGDPIFTFEIEDENGNTITKNIRFTQNDEATTKSTAVIELPLGNYKITELDTIRYEIDDAHNKEQEIELENENLVTVTFKNNLKSKNNYSHTDIVENRFTIDDNGNVSVDNDKLDQD